MKFKRKCYGAGGNRNDPSDDASYENGASTDEANPASTISQCLKYAEQVSDLFSDGVKSEKRKWKKLGEQDENINDEKVIWKHAKRVAKMVAIQSENLDHLVELIAENVSKQCPNHDPKEIKKFAKPGLISSNNSSYKGKLRDNTYVPVETARISRYYQYRFIHYQFQTPQVRKELVMR